jgi:hypothetical protein
MKINTIKGKKGINYIELMISFTMFLVFLTILFVYLNPLKQPTLSEVMLESLEQGIERDAGITLFEIPFKATLTSPAKCFKNSDLQKIGLAQEHIFVEDDFGNVLKFSLPSNIQNSSVSNIYHIFYSNDTNFSSNEMSGNCAAATISTSTVRSIIVYSENKIKNLNESYYSGYEDLKKQFDIPRMNDFSIVISDEDNNPIFEMKREIPQNVIVQARELPISIIKEDTKEIIKAYILLKVW